MDRLATRVAERYYIGPGTPEFQREMLAIHLRKAKEALGYIEGHIKGGKVRKSLLSYELLLKAAADMARAYGDDGLGKTLMSLANKAGGIDITQAIEAEYRDRPQR
jgi:hypothetical protein